MDGEFAYYAARSGLTPPERYSLADHKLAYFKGVSGLPVDRSLADHKRAFYRAQLGSAPAYFDLTDLEYAYMAGALGVTGQAQSFDDLKRQFVLIPVGPTEQRRNLFLNPAGAGAKSWQSDGNHAVTLNGTQAAGGPVANARWQKYTLTEVAAGTQVISTSADGLNAMPVLPNTAYIFSGYQLFSAGTITNCGIYQLEEYDVSGNLISAPFLTVSNTPAAGAWARDSKLITTGSTTRFVRPKFRWNAANMAIGDYFGVGGVLAELGSTLGSYFDGGFPDGGGNDYQWVGAADNSPSIILA